ncbi:MAG: flagellar FliJ family protein [Planctomycetota bacterium]|nr:flagellar FliJ family protein [Planctomycetota bacterium]
MTGFRFQLDALLRKLEADERSAYESLVVLQRSRTVQQDRLREIAQQNQEDLQQQASDLVGLVNPDQVRQRAARTFARTREADRLVLEIAAAEPAFREAEQRLGVVRRERRQYERLRERRLQAHRREVQRREHIEMDEIAQRMASESTQRWRMA